MNDYLSANLNQINRKDINEIINICAYQYFSTYLKHSYMLMIGCVGIIIFCMSGLITERIFYITYFRYILTIVLGYSCGACCFFGTRYLLLRETYDKITRKYNRYLTYYTDLGKYLYNPIKFPCPFLDNMFIVHMFSAVLLGVFLCVNIILWLQDDIAYENTDEDEDEKIRVQTLLFSFAAVPAICLLLDYAIWVIILRNITHISAHSNKQNSFSIWMNINYGINFDFNLFNMKLFTFYAPIDLNTINEHLKQVVEGGTN